ncbi:hypothetical protein EXU57_21255 [Segetibacter sp. 3557_3]|uniref:hypothetical protein n=1 Tax=Segetibacter sp. 3557_3 TaxID=2547429 RepID=UPI0010588C23|nr:hypothetical protein [Segetibacter sp. 3557_3]TDH20647.1 hypothetical protein EXU57_21255 [Segetibacter sp. 3557_3]
MSRKENLPPIDATFILLFVLMDASVLEHAYLNNNTRYLFLALLAPVLVAISWLVSKRSHATPADEPKKGKTTFVAKSEEVSHITYSQMN